MSLNPLTGGDSRATLGTSLYTIAGTGTPADGRTVPGVAMIRAPGGGNLLASQTVTASGGSAALTPPAADTASFYIHISAISGTTPTITFNIVGTLSDGTAVTIGSTTAQNATGVTILTVTGVLPASYTVTWTVAGTTPSITFLVDLYYR